MSKRSIESYATLPRTRSSGGIKKPVDEGSALINLTKQVSTITNFEARCGLVPVRTRDNIYYLCPH